MKRLLSALLCAALLTSSAMAGFSVTYFDSLSLAEVQADSGETVFFAAYDGAGRFVGVQTASAGEADLSAFEGRSVTAFGVDAESRPVQMPQTVTDCVTPAQEFTEVSTQKQLCKALWSGTQLGTEASGDRSWSVQKPVFIRLMGDLDYSMTENTQANGSPFTTSSLRQTVYLAPGSVIDLNGHTLNLKNLRIYYADGTEICTDQSEPMFCHGTVTYKSGNSANSVWAFGAAGGMLGSALQTFSLVSKDAFTSSSSTEYRIPSGITVNLTYADGLSDVTLPKRLYVSPGAALTGSTDFHLINASCRVILEAETAADLAPERLQYPYLDEIVLLADIDAPDFVLPEGVTLSYRGHKLNGAGDGTPVYTREQMQEAILQTALAYYYHDPYVQYESNSAKMIKPFSIPVIRSSQKAEDAEADQTVYTVCSDFGWRLYREVTGWSTTETSGGFLTEKISNLPADHPMVVYKFRGDDGETDVTKAIAESRACLQVGDLITYYLKDAGHMMVYVGDILGDGKEYVLHSEAPGGGSTDFDTGVNPMEPNGSISLQSFDQIVYSKAKRYIFSSNVTRFTITRPLDVLTAEGYSLTPEAAARLTYPRMEVRKTFDRGIFDGVQAGQTLSCTVRITNHSDAAYTAIPVTEPIPAGQTFVSADCGGVLTDGSVCWTADVPAGHTVELTYTIRVSGEPGDTLTFERGSAGGVGTRKTAMQVCGKPVDSAALAAVTESDLSGLTFRDLDTVNSVYKKLLDVDPGLPATLSTLYSALFETATPYTTTPVLVRRETVSSGYQIYEKMLLQKHFYGRYAYTGDDTSNRVTEFLPERYQPGDIFVNVFGSNGAQIGSTANIELQIYLGGSRVLRCTKANGIQLTTFADTAAKNLRADFGFVLRPSLAYADINAK